MIAEIIDQPASGEYQEKIYNLASPWNSQSWTWVKFTDDYENESVGQFRGITKDVKVSQKLNEIIVLTSDYIYRLNATNLSIIEAVEQPQYQNVEVSPNGIFIFHDYYEIEKMGKSLSEMTIIDSPFKMDQIRFKKWNGYDLEFECDEFCNWERSEGMVLDTTKWVIKIKNA